MGDPVARGDDAEPVRTRKGAPRATKGSSGSGVSEAQPVSIPSWIPRRLMTVSEVAELLRQSPRQIWRDIAAGKLAVVRLDGSTRVTPEVVAARIDNAST